MLALHHQYLLSNQALAKQCAFDYSSASKICSSIYQYLHRERIAALLFVYGFSIGIQSANQAIGYALFDQSSSNNGTTLTATVSSSATAVTYTYPLVSILHHLASTAYNALEKQDQNALKHLFAIAHDLISNCIYAFLGSKINDVDINNIISLAAPIISIAVIACILLAERVAGHPVLVPHEIYMFGKSCYNRCAKTPVTSASKNPEDPEVPQDPKAPAIKGALKI